MQYNDLTLTGQSRVNYIDALRGLSMILVVLAHVFLFEMPQHWDGSPLSAVLMTFRMPLFFFVSGYFGYKPMQKWTNAVVGDILTRKFRAQIICTLVFYTIFQFVHHGNWLAFMDDGFNYFWFTVALFQMFMVYVGINLLSRLVRVDLVDWALVLIIAATAPTGMTVFKDGIGVVLSWHQILTYAQYFCVGILVRKHWDRFERIMRADWFRTLVIVGYVGGCVICFQDWLTWPKTYLTYLTQGVLLRYAGLFTVLIFFHSRSDFFDGNHFVARSLRFVGRRTLDIYMMHMFFMPHLYELTWTQSINQPYNVVLKLAVTVPIALAIVAICLLCSCLLRNSHFLEVWLFGVRRKPRKPRPATA